MHLFNLIKFNRILIRHEYPSLDVRLDVLHIDHHILKGIYPEFQVIPGFSQKIPAGLLSYDQIHS